MKTASDLRIVRARFMKTITDSQLGMAEAKNNKAYNKHSDRIVRCEMVIKKIQTAELEMCGGWKAY